MKTFAIVETPRNVDGRADHRTLKVRRKQV